MSGAGPTEPGGSPGSRLRARREQLELTLEQGSAGTRIAVEHLRALEEDAPERLPEGPYAAAWARQYADFLGMEHAPPAPPELPEHRLPLPAVRLVVLGALVTFAVLLGVRVVQSLTREPVVEGPRVFPVAAPDQHVEVTALVDAPLTLTVDGRVAFDRVLATGESIEVHAHDRIEVELSAAEQVRVRYNGEAVVPQGRQDTARRLVFIDDAEGPT